MLQCFQYRDDIISPSLNLFWFFACFLNSLCLTFSFLYLQAIWKQTWKFWNDLVENYGKFFARLWKPKPKASKYETCHFWNKTNAIFEQNNTLNNRLLYWTNTIISNKFKFPISEHSDLQSEKKSQSSEFVWKHYCLLNPKYLFVSA